MFKLMGSESQRQRSRWWRMFRALQEREGGGDGGKEEKMEITTAESFTYVLFY